jgi:hypothetical protein
MNVSSLAKLALCGAIASPLLMVDAQRLEAAPVTTISDTPEPALTRQLVQAPWQSASPAAGRFSVQAPGTLQPETATTTIATTSLNWTIHALRTGTDRYAVAYTDLPLEVLQMGRTAVIESLKQRLLANDFDWQAIANRGQRINWAGIPGMEFLDLRNNKVSTLRLFLVKRRLYGVFATTSNLADAHRFVNSFGVAPLWQPFVSKTGQFSVKLPMAPIVSTESTEYQGQKFNWVKFNSKNVYALEDSYVVAYSDLSPSAMQAGADVVLKNAAQTTLGALGIPEPRPQGRAIALGKNPGQEFMATAKSGQSVVLRFYLVGQRLYGVFSSSKSLTNLDQFLNSFNVNKG